MSIVDCSVGPIEVIGSKAGDILEVEVIDIELAEQGVMTTAPNLGVLGDKITDFDTKIIKIKDGFAHFSPQIKIPLTPMIGVIGVFPPEEGVHCAFPGSHGGNMDTKIIKKGTKVYLPIYVDGAGLALGIYMLVWEMENLRVKLKFEKKFLRLKIFSSIWEKALS